MATYRYSGGSKYNIQSKLEVTKIHKVFSKMKNIGSPAQSFLEIEADALIKLARSTVPVKTGALQKSHRKITHRLTGRTGIFKVLVLVGGIVAKGKFVNYAEVVHEHHPTKAGWFAAAIAKRNKGFPRRVTTFANRFIRTNAR